MAWLVCPNYQFSGHVLAISDYSTVKCSLSTNTDIISLRLYQNNSPPSFTEHQPRSKKVTLLLAFPFHFQQAHNSSPNI